MIQRYPAGILVTCCVPWDEKQQLIEEAFRAEVRRMIARGYRHIYIFGTAGEGHAVDNGRFSDVAQVFREETRAAGVHAQVGVMVQSSICAIERVALAYEMGFRVFQLTLPSWGVLTSGEVDRFFCEVCGEFPDARFLHYNVMRSGRLLNGDDYRRIADLCPNLVATKITGADLRLASSLMHKAQDLQHFFVEMFPVASRWGTCSMLASGAAMYPRALHRMIELAQCGDIAELFRLHAQLEQVDNEILAPARYACWMDGAWDKMRIRLGGVPDFPLRLLSPYTAIPEETYQACAAVALRHSEWLK